MVISAGARFYKQTQILNLHQQLFTNLFFFPPILFHWMLMLILFRYFSDILLTKANKALNIISKKKNSDDPIVQVKMVKLVNDIITSSGRAASAGFGVFLNIPLNIPPFSWNMNQTMNTRSSGGDIQAPVFKWCVKRKR